MDPETLMPYSKFLSWTEAARSRPVFCGKRLSEIARMALSPDSMPGLDTEDRYVAMTALALGWLDIVEGAKNHYGQQSVDIKTDAI